MDWALRSRPAYIGEYEDTFPIPLIADSQEYTKMSGLPPTYTPGPRQPERLVAATKAMKDANKQTIARMSAEQRREYLKAPHQTWKDELVRAQELGMTAYTRKNVNLSGKGLPPRHKGSLKTQAERFAQVQGMMSHEGNVARSFGDTEGVKMAEELSEAYAKKHADITKKMETIRTKGITGSARRTTLRSKGNGGIVTSMLGIRDQIKVYHWQTKSFARHKATDDFVTELDGLIDSFVEVYMGKYGRPKVSGSIKLHNFSESAARSFVSKQTTYLSRDLPRKLKSGDTDLLNIRDEILALVNKTLYLFTLE